MNFKFNTLSPIAISAAIIGLMISSFYSCTKSPDFNSQNIVGSYEGKLIFKRPLSPNIELEELCTYDLFDDGSMIFTRSKNSKMDTSEWYINESAKKITIRSDFFFGTSINDLTLWDKDSLIFVGNVWVNIDGSPNEYVRTAKLMRTN